MHEATFTELRNNAKAFFDCVEQGETVRIYRNGHPVADIVPVKSKTPAWKNPPSTRLTLKGLSLRQEIIRDREVASALTYGLDLFVSADQRQIDAARSEGL